ncbi:hypothetical protein RCH21_003422 [Arthrobacter sp. PL16]|nr:hypothetical protein [Arthrobacter sp. PL16]
MGWIAGAAVPRCNTLREMERPTALAASADALKRAEILVNSEGPPSVAGALLDSSMVGPSSSVAN